MKKTLGALIVMLLLVPSLDGAAAKQRPKQSTNAVKRETPAKGVTAAVKRERKQAGPPSGDNPSAGKKPVRIGPPVERRLKKAKGKVFDLRGLPATPPQQRERPERHGPEPNPIMLEGGDASRTVGADGARQPGVTAAAPAPIITFEGLDRQNWGAGSPPDTNGDVGPTYYIQSVNTSVGVYRKSDGFREAAFTFDTLMSQGNFGNQCDTDNFGDPVVLYDTFEDRWILTDFAFEVDIDGNVTPETAYQCFAVSMNGDPVSGGWNFYSIELTDGLHDYPKLGIWPDGLYMTANMFDFAASGSFQQVRVWALNKAQMYAGSPTVQIVSFDVGSTEFTLIPSNARLQTGTPPAGTPNYFLSTSNYVNAVSVYKFDVDWTSLSLSTFTGPDLPLAATSWPDSTEPAVPQSGTATTLDALAFRAMVQNQYTNIGGVESLWVPHTVRRANTSGFAAPRWYQVNVTGGTVAANLPQATTWDPDAANVMYRFMPSLAVDRAGNMALGYSTSSSSTFPSIKYAGRLSTDPVNTFSQTEQVMFAGTASQTGTARWGDYSSMTLDPDGCTFWYTNEYANPASQDFDKRWKTRIGSFKYSQCTTVGAGGTISGTVTATTGGAPISGATISFGARSTTTNGSGVYSFLNIPAGTYSSISASFPGYTTSSASNIVVTDGGTTVQNFSLATAPANACLIDTTQADFLAGVATNVDLTATPGSIQLSTLVSLDQQTTDYTNNGFGFSNTSFQAQTFTPGLTGLLAKIDVFVFCSGCSGANPNLTVEVRTVSGGDITMTAGALLASSTIAGTGSGSGGFMTFNFATPPSLTAGTQYGFVVRLAAARTGTQAILVSDGSGLAGGRRQTCSTASCSNPTGQPNDIVFASYMNLGFTTSGTFVSSTKDSNPLAGLTSTWSALSWNGSSPANTTLRFQAAASSSVNGPFNFVGPDGTAATFFTTSPAPLTQFYGLRYLQYKAYLASTSSTATPAVTDVTVCYQNVDCGGAGPTITPGAPQACASSTGNTASAPPGMTSYAWSITNGTITGGASAQTVTYTAGLTGNAGLTLNVTEAGGCQKSNNLNVPIVNVPTPTINAGGPTTFCTGGGVLLTSSSASGNQWYLNGNPIGGETAQTYTATASGNYTVVVTTSGCASAPSSATTVTVNPIPATPTITPDGPTTFCTGGSVLLTSSSASGNQWYLDGNPIGGATNQTYNATAAGGYTVIVTTNGCSSAASSATTVTVNAIPATPTITPDGPTTFCTGGSVLLTSSSASGNQWSLDGNPIGGATNQTYNATASGNYTVVVTANGCSSAASTATTVTVNPIPATPTISGDTSFCTGGSTLLTSSSASGNQWYLDGNPIGGATNQTYNATAAGAYTVIVTTNGCSSASSSTTTVTVNPIPATPTITPDGPTTFCAGGSVLLTSSSATGNQWYLGGNPIGGETNQTYNATASGNYTVIVTANGCSSAASTATTVTVNPIPATPTITPGGPTTFCTGGSVLLTSSSASGNQWYLGGNPIGGETNQTYNATAAGGYTVIVTANGCASASSATTTVTVNPIPATPTIEAGGPTTFCAGGSVLLTSSIASGNQWYLEGNPISGETNQSYNATAAGNYTVVVTTNGCASAPSTATTVTVNPVPATPTITPGGPTTFCTGGSVLLTSSSASGNQWYLDGNPIGGETNQTYNATASGNYTVVVTASGCASAPSTATTVTINPIPATPTIEAGGPTTFCAGGNVLLTSSSASGNQWYLGGNPIGGATNQTYNATASGNYTVVVTTNGCTSSASSATTVTVTPLPPTPTITPGGPTTFCAPGSVLLTSSSASGNQWYLNGTPIGGATNSTFTATGTGNYTVVVTASGCSSPPSAATSVTSNAVARPTINAGGPVTYCVGGSVTLTSSSATGNQWYRNGLLLSGETGQNLAVTTLAGSYSVIVTANGCPSRESLLTLVTINPNPDATITVAPAMFSGASAVATAHEYCPGATFAWSVTGGTITSGSGTRAITFTAGAAGTLTVSVTVTNAYGCTDFKTADVAVSLPAFGAPPFISATATGTTAASLLWSAVGSAAHYEVYRATDGVNFTLRGTPTGTTFAESGLTASTTYFYRVRAIKADTTASGFSAIDPATTVVLTDDPVTSVCPPVIRAVHITQLRSAVNILRAGLGLAAFTFTDPSLTGVKMKSLHVTELRTALGPALALIGVTPVYTDPTLAAGSTIIKAAHLEELRDQVN